MGVLEGAAVGASDGEAVGEVVGAPVHWALLHVAGHRNRSAEEQFRNVSGIPPNCCCRLAHSDGWSGTPLQRAAGVGTFVGDDVVGARVGAAVGDAVGFSVHALHVPGHRSDTATITTPFNTDSLHKLRLALTLGHITWVS